MPLPSKHNYQEQKSFSELLTDPHFVFTMVSLFASLGVFFYYLFQLLFRTEDFRSTGSRNIKTPPSSRKTSGSGADLVEASAKGKRDVPLALESAKLDPAAGSKSASKATSPSAVTASELAALLAEFRERGERRKEFLDDLEKRVAAEAASAETRSSQPEEVHAEAAEAPQASQSTLRRRVNASRREE